MENEGAQGDPHHHIGSNGYPIVSRSSRVSLRKAMVDANVFVRSLVKNTKGETGFFFQLVFICSFLIIYTGSTLYLTALASIRINYIAGIAVGGTMMGIFSLFAIKLRDRRDENEMLAVDKPGYITWDYNVALDTYLALFKEEEEV